MEYEYSGKLKSLLKSPVNQLKKIIIILSICLLIVLGIYIYRSSNEEANSQKQHVIAFDSHVISETVAAFSSNLPDNIKYGYSSLTPQFLSDPFCSSSDETINYCIAVDITYKSYVVAIHADEMDKYKDLIAYSYGDIDVAPAIVTMKGIPEKMESDVGVMAIEALNTLSGETVGDTSKYSGMVGTLYLNTTKEPTPDYLGIVFCIIFAIGLAILYFKIVFPQQKYNKRQQDLLNRIGNAELLTIDQELAQPSTTYFESQKLYISENHIISKLRGLNIIPLNDIIHIYGFRSTTTFNKNQSIIAITNDGAKHEIASIPTHTDNNILNTEIIEKIEKYLPNIKYGFETSFFTSSDTNLNQESSNNYWENKEKSSNIVLGIIGAAIGAILGSIIWILIGKIGFIAGIAGFLMVIFTMRGYEKLAGSIDKKGQIISIFIAMSMIFVANYTFWALEICESFSVSGLINAYKVLPTVLTRSNLWGAFAKDVIIGYLLSIWSCYRLIKSVFTKAKN